jgi:hypothetical protein
MAKIPVGGQYETNGLLGIPPTSDPPIGRLRSSRVGIKNQFDPAAVTSSNTIGRGKLAQIV